MTLGFEIEKDVVIKAGLVRQSLRKEQPKLWS